MKREQLIIIGIDGAVPDFIEQWVAAGHLPNLQKLIEQGGLSRLTSVPNNMSPAAWSSFLTGSNPGKHGIFDFVEPIQGTQSFRFTNGSFRQRPSFWEIANRYGKKTAALFVPMSFPAKESPGHVQVSGWLTPTLDSSGATVPADLAQTIKRKFPDFHFHVPFKELITVGQYQAALDNKLASVRAKADVASYVAELEDWDLFFVVFEEADQIQHFFWEFMDEKHPQYKPGSPFATAIRQTYEEIDRAIGRLLAVLGEERPVLIMSDHGFQINSRGHLFVKKALLELGYEVASRKGPLAQTASIAYGLADRFLPTEMKHKLSGKIPALRAKMLDQSSYSGIDFKTSQAYALYLNRMASIRINLQGREPEGLVPPADYKRLVGDLAEIFAAAEDSMTGRPVVREVIRGDTAYCGPFAANAPDIVLKFEPVFINGLRLRDLDGRQIVVDTPIEDDIRSGDHADDGILIAAATGDHEQNRFGKGVSLQDLFPFILAQLGLHPEVVAGLDLDSDISLLPLDPAWAQAIGEAGGAGGQEQADYSTEEEHIIEERLRDLGYL